MLHIVVANEGEEIVQISIMIILCEGVIHASKAIAPTFAIARKSSTNSFFRWEVHYGRQVRIEAIVVLMISLPISYFRSRTRPAFAYDIDMRIFVANGFAPIRCRHFLIIGIRIYAQTIQISIFNPPDCPLLEILQEVGIVKVHIGHVGVKPTGIVDIAVIFRCIDIIRGRKYIVGLRIGAELMNPILIREILHPPMRQTAMVGHHIHNEFQAFLMRHLHHLAV